jgi:hypothetical protein
MIHNVLKRYVGGFSVPSLGKTLRDIYTRKQWIPIIDYAKEGSIHSEQVSKTMIKLQKDIVNIKGLYDGPAAFSLKLSTFAPCNPHQNMSQIVNRINDVWGRDTPILFDAEHIRFNQQEREAYNALVARYPDAKLFRTYQMYKKNELLTLQRDVTLSDSPCNVKLVRGAYMQSDQKTGDLFTRKEDTDCNYNNALMFLIPAINNKNTNIMVATHNRESVHLAMHLVQKHHVPKKSICFAQLLGLSDDLSDHIVSQGFKVYKYVPYGTLMESLPYLIRRLYENYPLFLSRK